MTNSRRGALAAALLLVGGCGLIDAIDQLKQGINFKLPEQSYTVSTMDPRWHNLPPGTMIPPFPCGSGGASCCMSPIDCTQVPLVCEAEQCALKFTFDDVRKVDLATQAPELGAYKGKVFTDILLKELSLQIDNTLNVSTPPVDLYVAPANVTSATGPGARKLATIASQPPGVKTTITVPLDPTAQQAFSAFARDVQTPFNVILSTGVDIKSGEPIPAGQVTFTLGGTVEGKL
jgi:hypothetical protein